MWKRLLDYVRAWRSRLARGRAAFIRDDAVGRLAVAQLTLQHRADRRQFLHKCFSNPAEKILF
jgi:hypothetical protein